MSHTPTPWNIYKGEISYKSTEDDQSFGMNCPVDINDPYVMRRIVACVNACEGLSTENLENNLPLVELVLMYNSTIKQRDQLLAALEEINAELFYADRKAADRSQDIARAAIKAVTGDNRFDAAIKAAKGE